MNHSIELRPCPFCGKPPECGKCDGAGKYISCENPDCSLDPCVVGFDLGEAAEKWNMRRLDREFLLELREVIAAIGGGSSNLGIEGAGDA